MTPLVRPFGRLTRKQVQQLRGFVDGDGILVKGLDSAPGPLWRGGCLSWLGVGGAATLALTGPQLGLPPAVSTGLGMTAAIGGAVTFVQTVRMRRLSKRLAVDPGGWHALAWTADAVCFRSWDLCVLTRWIDVVDVRFLDGSWGPLEGSLWLHLEGGDKVEVRSRRPEGTFAGRERADWYADLTSAWTAATGRRPSGAQGPHVGEAAGG